MMCAGLGDLTDTLGVFRECGVDYLHIDVMDGSFVPNYALGTDYAERLRGFSDIPLDIHLMVNRPEDKLGWFGPRPGDCVSVHCESTPHIHRALAKIKEAGATPIIALNPATHINAVEYLADEIGAALIMTVNPGYAGQALIERTLKKISDLRNLLDKIGRERVAIEVDGNVSFANAKRMRDAGADMFVAGSSSVFDKSLGLREAILKLRESVSRGS